MRLFDSEDNLVGLARPYSAWSGFWNRSCQGFKADGTPVSAECTAFRYDRLNRLTAIEMFPDFSSSELTRSCFQYDAHGNIKSVVTGSSASSGTDCSSCTQPADRYQFDDFGNVVEVSLAAGGVTRYQYDSLGTVIRKQSSAMAAAQEYLQYSYDRLGRLTLAERVYSLPTSGREVLYRLYYDKSRTLDASCPQPAHTMGRLLMRNDSVGKTWFQYDAGGRVVGEIRLRGSVSLCSGASPDAIPHTTYGYTPNGSLTSIQYPYGRKVTYQYGTGAKLDRVTAILVSLWDGTSWKDVKAISDVAWEPYGGLRGYQLNPAAGGPGAVEYFLGDRPTDVPPASCPTTPPSMASSDYSGRLRGLWVSSGPFVPGAGNGSHFRQTYTWSGEQLTQVDTCLLDASTPRMERYSYDRALRLVSATGSGSGGPFQTRRYSYDGRGNRTSETREDCAYPPTLGVGTLVDRLHSVSSGCAGSILRYDYQYDADGRVSAKSGPTDSSGGPAWQLQFASGPHLGGASDTVFRSVSVNGSVYQYFYDALNRRRLKEYPTGTRDEYFYDTGHQLLVDQGSSEIFRPVSSYPDDNYVWLAGRPVLVVRGKLSTGWTRQPDGVGTCGRNGESTPCGLYFLVSDYLGKPVLALDNAMRVTGVGEYEPFGQVNRVTVNRETAHPYANGTSQVLAELAQPRSGPSEVVRMRVRFELLDTEESGGTLLDYVRLQDGDTAADLASPLGGTHAGAAWSPWVQPSAGRLKVSFSANDSNCCPGATLDCSCSQAPIYPYAGVVMTGYEYQRFQVGAEPFWVPLRFPGQYHDAETDLFENWNRYYDPNIGRYLQPEPLLRSPNRVMSSALRGHVIPMYGYGQNNPQYFVDLDGLEPDGYLATHEAVTYGGSVVWEPGFQSEVADYRTQANWILTPVIT